MRTIDADKLYPDCMTKKGTLAISQNQIANAPTVEQPKGKWIFNKYNVWECSCCGGNPHSGTGYVPSIPMMKKQWKFCNLCGAQMGVDDNETDN